MRLPVIEGFNAEEVEKAVDIVTKKELLKSLPKTSDSNSPVLYVFRHGQSEDNASYWFSGWRNPKLTSLGETQALTLADKLSNKRFDVAISSTLKRALQTLEIVLLKNNVWTFEKTTEKAFVLCKANQNNLQSAYPKYHLNLAKYMQENSILLDDRIIERSYGNLQGTSKVELYLNDPEKEENYRRSYDFPAQNGESLKMVEIRVKLFLDELLPIMKQKKVNVILSCHSNSMRAIRRRMENLTIEEMCKLENPLAQDFCSYNV